MKAFSNRPTRAAGVVARVALLSSSLALAGLVSLPAHAAGKLVQAKPELTSNATSASFWQDVSSQTAGLSAMSARGANVSIKPTAFRAATLDKAGMTAFAAGAPLERSAAAALAPLVLSLPHPDGGFQRFAMVESPIMEAGLAAMHPEIKTYAGKGIDDPKATLRMDITPLGLHASVRSATGSWYVDPYYHLDDSVYASYYARNLPNPRGALIEQPDQIQPQLSLSHSFYHAADTVELRGAGFTPGATVTVNVRTEGVSGNAQTVQAVADAEGVVSASFPADATRGQGAFEVSAEDARGTATTAYHVVDDAATPNASVAGQLRIYRLALLTDNTYATYFGGGANVLAAKTTLINRVTQIYEDETSIRLMLINDSDKLNLDTAAKMTGTNGPCGGAACFTTAQAASCGSGTLTRNRQVVGLLVGASNFDIGHIGVGVNGGGIASLGVVGGTNKAQGCTGIPTPVGDFYAVDYVAHEMGHQFAGNHTFNGTISNCSTSNRNAGTSVEPGSGSSIMAYAGICGTDNLQPHSDPYWSQRSFDEIVAYTSGTETNVNEVQLAVLTGFSGTQQFTLKYNGNSSAPIIRGSNFTAAGIKAAVEAIPGWPTGGTVTASAVADTAFTVTFGGTLAGINVPMLELVPGTADFTGFVGEVANGGASTKRGISQTATGNNPPVVTVPAGYTIPVRTPFVLTGSATDPDGDTVTYMWEQNDRGATGTANGTGLITQPKLNGPLFRQFGTRVAVTATDTLLYNSPGENHVDTNPTRVFPDMAQILANNTNAETGSCPLAVPATPSVAEIDCFSEFLPTAAYVGTASVNASPASLNFRLTARDGRGGLNSAQTQLILAANAGPFLVTSPNTAVTLDSGNQTVTWAVANTDVAPVSTSNVKITLSTDSGLTFPIVLAASVPNTGSAVVSLPATVTSTARVKVEAVGNIFFDVSNADFSIKIAGDLNGDNVTNCLDLAIVKASMGKRTGQAGFDARADVDKNGVVDVRDLAYVSQRVAAGTNCN